MIDNFAIVFFMLSLTSLVFTGACITDTDTNKPVSRAKSQQMADSFLRQKPTFSYDGMQETIQLQQTVALHCPHCWKFIYKFSCRHAGYGNRDGEILLQVITPHIIEIAMEQGRVTQAIIDNTWDELYHKAL